MKNKRLYFFLILFFSFQWVIAQDTIPSIYGKVELSIKKGTMTCDFIMSNLPDISDYVIRINSGMNIHYFKDLKYGLPLYYDIDNKDSTSGGESIAYYLHENIGNPARYLPEKIELKYLGMYPVIADSTSGYAAQDWRGNIAFNGYSLRADGLQSAWYPILFDLKNQRRYEVVNYDITINCSDCSTLFVNGCKPVNARTAEFVSKTPHEIAIYCGDYKVTNDHNTYLLNPDMNDLQQKDFLKVVNTFKAYYAEKTGIPYNGDMTYIQTKGTAGPDHAFDFVASPSIINVGTGKYGLGAMFDKEEADRNKEIMAHELGHYYFGTLLRLNTVFGPVIAEGFAEYLSLKATKNVLGDSVYRDDLQARLFSIKGFKSLPFAKVKNEKDFNVREYYLYYSTPIILSAIEKEIGEKKMWLWIDTLVRSKATFTDYSFFEKTFEEAVPDKTEAKKMEDKYFTPDDALTNAVAELSK